MMLMRTVTWTIGNKSTTDGIIIFIISVYCQAYNEPDRPGNTKVNTI